MQASKLAAIVERTTRSEARAQKRAKNLRAKIDALTDDLYAAKARLGPGKGGAGKSGGKRPPARPRHKSGPAAAEFWRGELKRAKANAAAQAKAARAGTPTHAPKAFEGID